VVQNCSTPSLPFLVRGCVNEQPIVWIFLSHPVALHEGMCLSLTVVHAVESFPCLLKHSGMFNVTFFNTKKGFGILDYDFWLLVKFCHKKELILLGLPKTIYNPLLSCKSAQIFYSFVLQQFHSFNSRLSCLPKKHKNLSDPHLMSTNYIYIFLSFVMLK